ncbi:hypothetical protein FH972_026723 [Carpinus fangiana]|uniref:Xylanolytic transcriptional activator regulatory domain-containing protein n=1 Tax=Carpinus fangiana TaxID=176857 RepID=A0A5N6L4U2_9ROSI|nr:hypothetical protein FH972_026723 [Carpinus fangiana]
MNKEQREYTRQCAIYQEPSPLPPPPYEEVVGAWQAPPHPGSDRYWQGNPLPTHRQHIVQASSSPFLPIVIPQITKSFGSAFASPFVRAYAPSLEDLSSAQFPGSGHLSRRIDATTFLAFLDGLNEAFIGSPAFQALNLVGTGMSFAPLLTVKAVGGGLSLAAGLGSAAMSYSRTLLYVRNANETLFRPAGLKLTIKSTRDMMAIVGVDGDRLQLPPLDEMHIDDPNFSPHVSDETSPDDPRMRRLRALGNKVARLTFNVPAPTAPDHWLKKMGDWQAQRAGKKQNEKLLEARGEAAKHHNGAVRKAEEKIAKVQHDMDKVEQKAHREMERNGHKHSGREAEKIERERRREMEKLEKDMNKAVREGEKEIAKEQGKGKGKAEKKEQAVAQKIRWIVITRDDGLRMEDEDEGEDHLDVPGWRESGDPRLRVLMGEQPSVGGGMAVFQSSSAGGQHPPGRHHHLFHIAKLEKKTFVAHRAYHRQRCDRGQPCDTCVRRGQSFSCTYAPNNVSAEARSRVGPARGAPSVRPQDRIAHLETLVNSMIAQSKGTKPDVSEQPVEVLHNFGRISLENSEVGYVESSHWTAILEGIASLRDHFDDITDFSDSTASPTDHSNPLPTSSLLGWSEPATREEIIAAVPPRPVADRLVAFFFNTMKMAPDSEAEHWLLYGVVIRAALRMGYHRDPSQSPRITPFQAEMRRRVWVLLTMLDVGQASQFGLPRMIKRSHCDTQEPRNLEDEDFDEDTVELPPSRPDNEPSHTRYLTIKTRLMSAFGEISDLTASVETPEYSEIMKQNKVLQDAWAAVPQCLLMKPMTQSVVDTPGLIIQRLALTLVFHKCQLVLHRRFLLPARTDSRYTYSRTTCIEAALQVLHYQQMMDQESQPGGRLYYDRLRFSALLKTDFFLANSILCLDLDRDLATHPATEPTAYSDTGGRDRLIQALRNSYTVWSKASHTSKEASKAAKVLRVVLGKAQRMGASSHVGGLSILTQFSAPDFGTFETKPSDMEASVPNSDLSGGPSSTSKFMPLPDLGGPLPPTLQPSDDFDMGLWDGSDGMLLTDDLLDMHTQWQDIFDFEGM